MEEVQEANPVGAVLSETRSEDLVNDSEQQQSDEATSILEFWDRGPERRRGVSCPTYFTIFQGLKVKHHFTSSGL